MDGRFLHSSALCEPRVPFVQPRPIFANFAAIIFAFAAEGVEGIHTLGLIVETRVLDEEGDAFVEGVANTADSAVGDLHADDSVHTAEFGVGENELEESVDLPHQRGIVAERCGAVGEVIVDGREKLAEVVRFIRDGKLNGDWKIYENLLSTISDGSDYYLLNQDFSPCWFLVYF